MNAIEISLTGLDVEWRRLEVIAMNLANMNAASRSSADGYSPMHLVSGPAMSFETMLTQGAGRPAPAGVQVLSVEQSDAGMRSVYEPDHPLADDDGMVWYPNVDRAAEMTAMIRTSRAYEANLTAVSLARQMYQSALEIGRQS